MTDVLHIHPETPQPRLIRQAVDVIRGGGLIAYPTDTTYALHRRGGEPEASTDPPPPGRFADLVAYQWRALMERPAAPTPPGVQAQALACVHAALLSARTGQPESPAKLLQLSRT